MIPILFESNAHDFTTNGLGRLNDCISCTVTEERNGIYECEFTYPIIGKWYTHLIENGGIIGVIHDDVHDIQPFDIYAFSAPIDGVVTFNAHHISYRLNNVITKATFTATTVAQAFQLIANGIVGTNDFTFWTDKTSSGTMTVTTPSSVRALLGGSEGSILDSFGGGEYKFDGFTVRLYANRGSNLKAVTIRYGKNLTDINYQSDSSTKYNAVLPYWASPEGEVVVYQDGFVLSSGAGTKRAAWTNNDGEIMTDGNGTQIDFSYYELIPSVLDLSEEFDEAPSQADLEYAAQNYMNSNSVYEPEENITIDFVHLWQTPEYANVAGLQRVSLCDQVSVYYPELGVVAEQQKVVKVVYNVLLERYDSMELGSIRASLADSISSQITSQTEKLIVDTTGALTEAINHATELITGGLGGHVVFTLNASGEPQEILIMDTDDINTAANVIRFNSAGIGFSRTGYEGPFYSAWTIDGSFNADFIATGSLLANFIQGGTLSLGGADNGNGVLQVFDADGNNVMTIDRTAVTQLGTLHLRSDFTGTATVDGEFYYNEYPETAYNNPTRYPNENWHKRKTKMVAGSVAFSKIITNTADDGELPTPTEVQLGSIAGSADGVHIVSGIDFATTIAGGASAIMIGGFLPAITPNPSSYDKADQISVSGNMWMAHGIKWVGSTAFVTRMVTINGGSGGFSVNYSSLDGATTYGYLHVYEWNSQGRIEAPVIQCEGLSCTGTKNRIVKTKDYGTRKLYSYETPTPLFGDVGEGQLDGDGIAYIEIDPVFAETIDTASYQVFLQKYGQGDCWVEERHGGHFIVKGTPGLKFAWEIKAKQKGFENLRLDENVDYGSFEVSSLGELAADWFLELEEGRMTA